MERKDAIIRKVIGLAHRLDEIEAIGLSGSYSRHLEDSLSDVDICIYVRGTLPPADSRERAYHHLGLTDWLYFDVDFEQSRGDGVRIDGQRCDLCWMSIPAVSSFLRLLRTDFDCAEWLPGGLSTVETLHDPKGRLERLRAEIPVYSHSRARHRFKSATNGAYISLYNLGWLKKAAFREDYFSFLKNEYDLLEKLFYALFALNQEWYSDEKRLTRRIMSFEYVPEDADKRIQSVVMREGENRQLRGGLESIKGLFEETVSLAHCKYPDLDLPKDWA